MQNVRLLTIFLFVFLLQKNLPAQIGSLDNTFNGSGIVEPNLSRNNGHPSILIQANKKIILGGAVEETLFKDNFTLFRYLENGALDETFGEAGRTITKFEQLMLILNTLHFLPNNKIQALGNARDNFDSKDNFLVIVQYKLDGSLDNSFGEGGKLLIPSTEEYETITSITLEEERNTFLVLAHSRFPPQEGVHFGTVKEFYLKRYDFNGNLDDGFGENGKLIIDDNISSVEIQSDNKILLLGTANENSESGYLITRYFDDGSVDTTFGNDGNVIISFGANQYRPAQIKSLPNEKIIILGSILKTAKNDFALARLNNDGTIDASFGIDGKITTEFSNYSSVALQANDIANAMGVQQDGKIVVVGGTSPFTGEINQNQAIVRYDENGALDRSFGDSGKIITSIPNRYSEGTTVLFEGNGKILVGGFSWTGAFNEKSFLLTRYLGEINVGALNASLSDNRTLIYPNPIKNTATLEYRLEKPENLTIQLTDFNGQILKTYLQNELQKAGAYQQELNLPNDLPKGFYFVRMVSENVSENSQVAIKVVK